MSERLLCPSMMCANYGHLADEVRALDVTALHDRGNRVVQI